MPAAGRAPTEAASCRAASPSQECVPNAFSVALGGHVVIHKPKDKGARFMNKDGQHINNAEGATTSFELTVFRESGSRTS